MLVTAAARTQTTAAMPGQQNVDGHQGESVRAADAMDGGVAMAGPVETVVYYLKTCNTWLYYSIDIVRQD